MWLRWLLRWYSADVGLSGSLVVIGTSVFVVGGYLLFGLGPALMTAGPLLVLLGLLVASSERT